MDAIDDLISAAESGTVGPGLNTAAVFGDNQAAMDAVDAFHGSLDAAKALHDAMLPGWSFYAWVNPPGDYCVDVAHLDEPEICGRHATSIARAWLLAILRAMKAKAVA